MVWAIRSAALVVAVAASAAGAMGTFVVGDIAGSAEQTGATFAGTVAYDASLGLLTVDLSNTTPGAVGGFMTGVGFMLDGAAFAGVSLSAVSDADFLFFTGGSAPSFGTLGFGAALGANFSGGGSPAAGIATAGNFSASFLVTGGDAAGLDSEDFASALVVRFRGLSEGRSDTVGTTVVPAPASAALLAAGGVLAARRRR